MIDYGAVLIIGQFIVSVFNVPLGNPMYQFIPYPNMEVCQQYAAYHALPPEGYQVSIEYKLYNQVQCMTKEEFQAALAAQQGQTAPTQPEEPAQDDPISNWWSQ